MSRPIPWFGVGASGASLSLMVSRARRWPSTLIVPTKRTSGAGAGTCGSRAWCSRRNRLGERTRAGGQGCSSVGLGAREGWLFIEPGKPIQNAFAESCQGRLCDDCLDRHWSVGLDDARPTVNSLRQDDQRVRPHSALGTRPPQEFRWAFEETAIMGRSWWDSPNRCSTQGGGHLRAPQGSTRVHVSRNDHVEVIPKRHPCQPRYYENIVSLDDKLLFHRFKFLR